MTRRNIQTLSKSSNDSKQNSDTQSLIEEEEFLIQHSGEIPEVAFYNSLYYLQENPEGPKLSLTDKDLMVLKLAVIERYKKIILRDLTPENRDKRIYRGIKRSHINYTRLKNYAQREDLCISSLTEEIKEAFLAFLKRELEDCLEDPSKTSINCSYEELLEFSKELGLGKDELPSGIEAICPKT